MKYLLILFSLFSFCSLAEREKCTITTKYVCTLEECVEADSTISVYIDIDKKEYSRCINMGCDTYKMNVDVDGNYINMTSTGFKSKVSVDRKEFMEYVSLKSTSYLSYGSCK